MIPERLFLRLGAVLFSALVVIAPASGSMPPAKPLAQSSTVVAGQGLGQNWEVQQGPDGLIYVGGNSSLLVFDGESWRSIETPDEGRVRDLDIDDQGRIWVASPGQFGFFERDGLGTLAYHSISENLPEEEQGFGETRYVHVLDDTVYFNTFDRLYRWSNGELGTFDKWDGLFRYTFTARGRYYVVVRDRIYDFTDFPASDAAPSPEERWRWPDKARITFLSPWKDDQLVLGTYDDGLYVLSEQAPRRLANDSALVPAWPYKVLRLTDGTFIVLTINSGIFHYRDDGQLLEHVSDANGLPVNITMGATVDKEGGLWLAQDGAIARLELALPVRYYDKDANAGQVRALIEHQGHLLTGGAISLGVLEPGDPLGQIRDLELPVVQEAWGLHSTPQGVLVSGFQGVHLVEIDETASTIINSAQVYEDTYSYTLFPSPSRPVVYIESENGLGVLIGSETGWQPLAVETGITERPASVAEDIEGRVWVGFGDGRYKRLTWNDDSSLQVDVELGPGNGVPPGNAHVFRLGDRLIFGTTQGGYRLATDGQHIEPDPLFGNEQFAEGERDVTMLISPDQERILGIIGPDRSIFRGQFRDDGSIEWFGPHLQQLDPGHINFVTEEQGTLWLGQAGRMYRMDWPEAAPQQATHEQLNLRWAGFPDVQADTNRATLTGHFAPGQSRPAALPHGPEALRFEYALASYVRPEKTLYRSVLEGHDSDWSRWSDEARRDYTNLGGGDYQFRVQARNVLGAVSESRAYAFTVRPPWYLSGMALAAWFIVLIMLLWSAAWLGQRQRQQRLLATQQQLENKVAERTAEVRQQARELRELGEARSRFFANVSHEFRTPLTLARGPLEDLARGEAGPLSDDAKRYVGMALRNTETMQGLIGQILDINRLEANRMPISVTRDDFGTHVKTIADEFTDLARQQGITLTVNGPDEPVMADFDPGHMATIIRNLLGNALKFTPRDGSITVNCAKAGRGIELRVTDTGCGIDEKDLAHVFERYYQGDQSHASQPGTGIGLALVRELVELHEGSVLVKSEPGDGTLVIVSFPDNLPELKNQPVLTNPQIDDTALPDDPDANAWLADAGDEDVPTVLVVDDNAELRAFLNMRLRGSFRVLEAGDGEAGLEMARSELPDIVVTDVMMPKMTGLELTAALRSDPQTDFIPILMLSARTTRRDTVAGLEQGADDYLAKPFDSAELATRVAGLIASRRKLRQMMQADPDPGPNRSPFLDSAHTIVMENLGDPRFGARDWADLLHMDRTTLYRKLKAETDQSPEEYLREQRLLRAAELLKSRAGNVSQVAVAVGFNSISYFSRRFKERFNQTPASFS